MTILLASLLAGASAQDKKGEKKKDEKKAEPKVVVVLPLGVAPGETKKLVVRGFNLDSATAVKIGETSAKILNKGKAGVPDKNPERVGDTQVEIEVTLAKGAKGPSLPIVVTTPAGSTPAHGVLVETERKVIAGKEPNEGFKSAMEVPVPSVIEGVVERAKDVEVFRFTGKKGQKVRIEVVASRQGSPLDAMLTVYNERIQQLAFSDDFDPAHRDAKIELVLPADGVFFVSLIDAHDTGSAIHVYRLRIE